MALQYREVTGYFTARIPDSGDADLNPDTVPLTGNVTFHPEYRKPLVFPGEHIVLEPINAIIIDGQLMGEVIQNEDVVLQALHLPVTMDERANQTWSWVMRFNGVTLGQYGETVEIPDVRFVIEEGDGPLDLSTVPQTTARASSNFITRGERGAGLQEITAEDGELVFHWDNGNTAVVPVPDGPEGPPGPMVDVTAGTVGVGATPTDFGVSVTGEGETRQINVTLPKPEKGDKGEEGPYGGTAVTDPQVASYVADSGSDTAVALRKSMAPGLIHSLRYPVKIAHRGGPHVYPEHSMEAYDAAFAAGYTPEADVQALADGTLVCIHDTTTTRTMTGAAATVAEMSRADWEAQRVRPPAHDNVSSTGYGTPVLFEDYLDRFGGRGVLFVESKGSAHVPAIMESITRRGLLNSVVVQTNAIAGVNAIVAAGGTALLLTTEDPALTAGRGAKFVGVPSTVDASHVAACHAAGLKVIMYTLNSRASVEAAWAKGVDGVFSDDPWEVFRPVVAARHLDLSRDYLATGMAAKGGSNLLAKVDGGALTVRGDNARTFVKLGAFGYGADRLRVRFWVQGLAATTTAGWLFGLYLGSADGDLPVTETTADGVQWRLLLCRTDGEKRLYRREYGGTTTQMAAQPVTSGPYFPTDETPGPAMQFEVEFTATQVIARNLTRNDEPLIGTAASLSESGQYLNLAAYHSTIRFWDIQVTRG